MANYNNDGRKDFPTLDINPSVTPAPIGTAMDLDVGLGHLAKAATDFGNQLGEMAEKAANHEGFDAATQDALAGTLRPQNDMTVYGAAYNRVARAHLGAERKAGMATAMGEVFARYPDDPEKLSQGLDDVRKGFGSTKYPELDLALDENFSIAKADYLNKAQVGQRGKIVETAKAGLISTDQVQGDLLEQTAAGATFDQPGADRVAAASGAYLKSMIAYGPPEEFMIGDVKVPADPNRTGVLSPAVISQMVMARTAGAKKTWIINAVDKIPGAEAKRAFLADLHKRYENHDPMLGGLDGDTIKALDLYIDGQANKDEAKGQQDLEQHAQKARGMLSAWQWGGDVDPKAMLAEAQASGDAGLVAQAEFFSAQPQFTKGILKTAVAQQAGLTGAQGGGVEWVDGSGVPVAGANQEADGIRATIKGLGGSDGDANYLVRNAVVESSLDPRAQNGSHSGLYQFKGGKDLPPEQQTRQAYETLQHDRASLKKTLGREPTYAELYLAHQQGIGGAQALLTAPAEWNVIDALAPAYGGDRAKARAAVVANGGNPDGTAGDFVGHVKGYFAGNKDNRGAWAPPPGMKPGSPAYAAWANTAEGFSNDPMAFVRGSQTRPAIAEPPPLVPDGAFSKDPAQSAAWGDAMRKRQALGLAVSKTYGVPFRMTTNGERDYYKQLLDQNPGASVALGQAANAALGTEGARQFFRELGVNDSGNLALHIGSLSLSSPAFANRAVEGMNLQAQGAHLEKTDGERLDKRFADLKPAFAADPQFLVTARRVAEFAMISDKAKGIDHGTDFYVNSAIGASVGPAGQQYGGFRRMNGHVTPVPNWLVNDRFPDAMNALGARWVQEDTGPRYSNGQRLTPRAIAGASLVLQKNGRYALVGDDGTPYRDRFGGPFTVDLNGARPFLTQALGKDAIQP